MSADPIVIAAAARTPMSAFQGALKNVSATTSDDDLVVAAA